ncbi:hypothetical protein J2S55_008555 [Streptosporangium brasiliense]|uniref:Uncharacterized protein n=1 Tax=Streptosporangium brasiliense TaxID=47480 RepID=A0ABT9RJ16_9ACTN|nr:hypothetical protein [Streptosporangium brasiliense]
MAEALRYRSPHVINSANLTTRRELVIGTTTLPPHTPVRFLLAAMNRDETAFPHADTFASLTPTPSTPGAPAGSREQAGASPRPWDAESRRSSLE